MIKKTQLFSNKVDRLQTKTQLLANKVVALFENTRRTMGENEDRRRKTIEKKARSALEGFEIEMDLLELRTLSLERLVQSGKRTHFELLN